MGFSKWAAVIVYGLIAALYIGYLTFIVSVGHGAVDYDTFITIGHRWLDGREVYIENSHYPLPTVMIFGLMASLPDWLAIIVWHTAPVLLALWITRNPMVLCFAPLFAHFVGGQTAIFGLVGLWGYRRWQNEPQGGAWLAVMLFKPQLGIIPIAWAMAQWRHQPKQAVVFFMTSILIVAPSFMLDPTWLWRWLHNTRTLRPRAMSAIVPRLMIAMTDGWLFWVVVVLVGGIMLWRLRKQVDLDMLVLWGFVVSPLVHDYDVIQLIPLMESRLMHVAVVLSLPLWVVILGAYNVDAAWGVVSLIGVGLMGTVYKERTTTQGCPYI